MKQMRYRADNKKIIKYKFNSFLYLAVVFNIFKVAKHNRFFNFSNLYFVSGKLKGSINVRSLHLWNHK